ncbi:putative stromal cell-derived factor 2 [Monocercomonoides exilis]|uniref:putative stromal cell-derived factor 2 n=1 Tax=Monocercomonoides exilis TaxID=2049356 RepID=UPI0035598E15|nr:putative stromal cell-derived factor 2 [Monocercomonoides exilis]|eukprot:MONOS_2912.1-p1 / transcript=MONOS_2912.1 / gene=MONOS_2912 / organism=Monocercomonoides_exilis_PA203 / gene_product=GF16060 / transcript_product=GF16060 / location=Mono_scaffold00063:136888-137947(-) / protein_length=218 / sequence_SO=supercontig / SO=protein_coding / is_pseudo=false
MQFSFLNLILIVAFATFKVNCSSDKDVNIIDAVTYGSSIKLQHISSKHRLHSHEVPYGQGSYQQSVTGYPKGDDPNSLWLVKAENGKTYKRGTPVKCGDEIRLEHVSTKRNLHSHNFKSPISSQQEVSCFGDKGVGDSMDNWKLICIPNKHNNDIWNRGAPVMLQHVATKKYLFAHKSNMYNPPLTNQIEVTAFDNADDAENKWKTAEGVYFPIQTAD